MSDQISLNYTNSLKNFNDFQKFYSKKQALQNISLDFNTSKTIVENLNDFASLLLDSNLTTSILVSFNGIFLDLVSRCIADSNTELKYTQSNGLNSSIKGSHVLSTLGRIIHLAPEVAPLVEFFLENNPIFQNLENNLSSVEETELHHILLAFYRLSQFDHNRYLNFIQLDLLSVILKASTNSVIKFLCIQLLAKGLNLAEKAKNDMLSNQIGEQPIIASYENDSEIDYRFLPVLEAQRLANFHKIKDINSENEKNSSDIYITINSSDLSSLVVSVCGVLVPKIHFDQQFTKSHDFVPTPRSVAILKELAYNVQHSKPVVLVGGAGSGKTFIINELSKYLACDKSIVKIHLGEQTDAKLLLGTYSSGSKPGTFEWRNGVLTTAVKEGRWILIEDIDKAPTEVLSMLLSLLEKRELTIPSRGEIIKAANGFQLISTIRTTNDSKRTSIPDLIGMRLWTKLTLEQPSRDELSQLLAAKYPLLQRLIPSFLQLYDSVQETYNSKSFLVLNKGSHLRVISTRDLIKFCKRVDILLKNNAVTDPSHLLKSSVLDDIFAEAVDCFASALSEQAALTPLINTIGGALQVPSSRIQLFLQKHVPLYEDFDDHLIIGRAHLKKAPAALYTRKSTGNNTSFARTNHSLRLMEQVGVSVQMTEPVLLVGETGTGKTTVVQQVAKQLNKKITVINVSQQTEAGDLLGGFKPVNVKSVAVPIQETFLDLFQLTFSTKKNEKFERALIKCFNRNQWKNVIKLWNEAVKLAHKVLVVSDSDSDEAPKKKRRINASDSALLLNKWDQFKTSIINFEVQSESMENSFVFNFVEGSLVQAVKNGHWLLLDEINLASSDTLESVSDLLSDIISQRSVLLTEKGEVESIQAHPDFRIFGCMNPATDVGKRDLPLSIRSRFTEIYVHSPDGDISDLLQIIDKYVGRFALNDEWIGNDIAQLYLKAKELADSNKIVDGANQKPHFSIRTLTRTLLYVCDIYSIYGLRRSLFEGFSMSFLTLLDQNSESILKPLIEQYTIGRLKNAKSVISQIPPAPSSESGSFVQFRHYWMKQGPFDVADEPKYIITPFVEKNLLNLVRATSGKRFPILVQGPTSSGKTSMIKYLADITGNKFVRINNHEHTDLQEYLGTYVSDDTGKLSFKEGVLVEALRKGYWLVLDELNLAPTDVLEALNRLLDDNRELFIPETQEVVHPHPDFMLFATQNPPGLYGGRKVLSRAFRNRFLELHFDDIPQDELEIILRERCQIAPSYAKKIIEVYRQLSVQRQSSRLFEQKNSFATLRDLFRWAMREAVGYDELASNGYMLLAERVRKPEEKLVVKQTIEKVMRVKLDMDSYYNSLENNELLNLESSVVWTKAIRRLAVLISASLKNNEPVLLVGETGCGKTTVCQLLAEFAHKKLITVNAHQNTETGDLLGAQRPVRNKSELQTKLLERLGAVMDVSEIPEDLDELLRIYDGLDKTHIDEEAQKVIKDYRDKLNLLFEWSDGPLIQALKTGQYFLLDEISLADDSVLERLNSVLEPERSLLLAEKGAEDSSISAADGFQFLATMNPGGDYGKKELSPALRNRFTEIWVPSMEDFNDVLTIVEAKLDTQLKSLAHIIVEFSESFGRRLGGGDISSGVISLRDILAWVEFSNKSYKKTGSANGSLLHGACMVFIDSLGTNNTAYLAESEVKLDEDKLDCVKELSLLAKQDLSVYYKEQPQIISDESHLSAGMFSIDKKAGTSGDVPFTFEAPTTAKNTMRVVRALQLSKPILLEGSPGVGKTSLVSALAEATGNPLTRINLSEQTDLVDLFGSDAPVEGGKAGEFAWRDAPFLRAMQKGEWVLLDEMNLASQSVLEGLNACLDHRGEAYIPELDKSFPRHENFLVFAAQNPQYQGGGRKGLPKSFVNRFSVVYVDTLSAEDLVLIAHHLFANIPADTCSKMIQVVSQLEYEISTLKKWGTTGGPWEFNLRDTLRWLKLYDSPMLSDTLSPVDYLDIIICQRFRTESDGGKARSLVEDVFGGRIANDNLFALGESFIQAKKTILARNDNLQPTSHPHLSHLQSNTSIVESSLLAIQNNWPVIYVGPTNAGKTELVRYLSTVSNSKVVEFSMNSDIDSMDILGGYEQVDLSREVTLIVHKLQHLLKLTLATQFKSDSNVSDAIVDCLRLVSFLDKTHISLENYTLFAEKFNKFKDTVKFDFGIQKISDDIEILSQKIGKPASVRFEWFDGLLVKAVEQGHWLVLDNANLCSPSVLDRLNSLLEINGSLIINECSLSDGQARVIHPHENFRLFLTMDPKFGELSRAMRNRGVEIYIDSLESRSTTFDKRILNIPLESASAEDEITLSSLSVDDSKSLPLATFIDPSDSFSYYISLAADSLKMSERDPHFSRGLSTIIPFVSQNALAGLLESVSRSSEFPSVFVDELSELVEYVKFLSSTGFTRKFYDLYSDISEKANSLVQSSIKYDNYQRLNPLWNIYVYMALNKENDFNSHELISFFELLSNLFDASSDLKQIELKGANGKLTELNHIEQCYAAASGRNIKNEPRLNIYKLLQGVQEFIISKISPLSAQEIIESKETFEALYQLSIVWLSLAESSVTKNDSKTRVYQKFMRNWASKSENIGVDDFKKLLDSFEEDLKLKRGVLMAPIWEKFRGTYPQSGENWLLNSEILKLMKKFDDVAFQQFSDSESLVSSLAASLLVIYEDIVSNNLTEAGATFEKLESGIKVLEDISSKFLVKRVHTFEESFKLLFNFSVADNSKLNDDVLSLAYHSGLGVSALAGFANRVYPTVFDTLWEKSQGSYKSHTTSLFTDKFLQTTFVSVSNFNDSTGQQLDQTVADSLGFFKHLVKNSESITSDRVQQHKNIICSWYSKILALVSVEEVSVGDFDIHGLEWLISTSSKVEDEFFQKVNQSFFIPALTSAANGYTIEELGQAWVLFAIGLVQLYVPDSPYDPAIEEHVVYTNFERKKALCSSIAKSFRSIRTINFGDDSIFIEKDLPSISESDTPEKPRVYRTSLAVDNLFEEWQSFMVSTLDTDSLTGFLEAAEDLELEKLALQFDLFQQNSSSFIERLQNKFTHFSDVNDIFKGYIFGIKLGFDLILESRRQFDSKYRVSPLWFINPQELTISKSFDHGFSQLKEFSKAIDVESSIGEKILRYLMDYSLSVSLNSASNEDGQLEQIFQALYYRWSLRRTRKEQKEAEDGSLFKYKGETETDEDFKQLFPDYEDFVQTGDGVVLDKGVSDMEEEHSVIAERYVLLFLEKNPVKLDHLIREGSEIAKRIITSSNDFKNSLSDPSTLAIVIKKLDESITAVRTPVDGSELDFYRGYSSSELTRSLKIIQRLLKSVRELLEQWPEHATLQTLDRISLEYLSYPVKTPMAKLIQKIEQIYTFISEWEKYASVKVSLKIHFDELTSLIVSWRKLELSSWKSLFRNEDRTNAKSIGVWWFNLFETIILPSYGNEEIEISKLISSLNIFISKSTYGQYTPRLNLLKAFTEHTLLISKDKSLKNSLKNLISYYEQFTPIIDEHLEKERRRLQKDVDEVILLASWKDVNIDALKQSARRSHHNLYKLVRKYRDVLGHEVTSLIEDGISPDHKVSYTNFKINVAPFDSSDLDEFNNDLKTLSVWNERPSRLKYSHIVVNNMKTYGQRLEDRDYPKLLEFVKETVEEMERLKSETPKEHKEEHKEEHKKTIASLKTQKRKLLTDTIRELRRIGLKTHLREDIHKLQSSATLILANSESLRDSKVADSESYFFRILDLLPRLRATVSNVAEDVPVNDAEKGLAVVENLIYYLINNKRSLLKISRGFEKLESVQERFGKITKNNNRFISKDNFLLSKNIIDQIFRWLPQLLDFVIEVSNISGKVLSDRVDNSIFNEIKSEIQSVERKISGSWEFNDVILDIYSKFEIFLNHHITLLKGWKSSNPNFGFLADIIINWISEIGQISISVTSTEEVSSLDKIDSLLRSISSKVLVVFQKINQSQESLVSHEDDKWFTSAQKELSTLIKSLHIASVTKSFDSLFEYVESNSFDASTTLTVEKLISLSQPFLKGYMELMAIVLNKYSGNYYDISRSTYILSTSLYNLAKDGFCSPQEKSEEKESDNLQDGTGLGDGEGATNNSNDVEDDEDLTENAQEPNKEKDENKDEEDDSQDAVDIEGDMAGDLEDLSDQDKDDEDEDDEDKEEEELDEEVDDLDDLDPNAVDDKMWDEEAKDDKKEKDSENMPENSNPDDVQANEDEEQGDSKDNEKPNEQDGEDDNKDDQENDDDADQEEDVGEQEDEVKNEEREELEQNVPETETLDLPDDINLDSGDEDDEDDKDVDDNQDIDDGLDDKMDLDEEEEDEGKEEIQESEDFEENEDGNPEEAEKEVADKPDDDLAENEDGDEEEKDEEGEQDPLEQGEQSDEELDNANQENHNPDANEDEVDGDQMEGIDDAETGDNNNEDIDMETAVEQQAGEMGEGAQTQDDQEKEDVGASGSAQFQEKPDSTDDKSNDDARDEAKESLKQLGDSLKEFHRRHQEIKEASEKDDTVEQSANERPDEFEHIEGDNTENDTQALGAANKDQVSKIDDDMAIDDDLEEEEPIPEANAEEEGNAIADDSDMEEVENSKDENNPDEFNGKTKGGIIGERKEENAEDEDDLMKAEIEEDEEDVDEEIESHLLKPDVYDEDFEFRDLEEARELWRKSELETQDLAANLTEQLRLILEPTLATKLKGDYKTGKRLNMKRIIPYIASDFRKDKIWLRRTKPSKRQYQIMIAVDDSKSMSESKSVDLAFQSICLVSKALTQLESGGLSIVRFGEDVKVVHPFDRQFSPDVGAKIFQKFDFQQTRTNTKKLVSESIEIFNNARALGDSDLWQLQIIISDGVCEDHDTLQRLVRRAREEKIMLVFVVIDGINSNESIMDMQQVRYEADAQGNMVLKVDKYLDSFPFEFYVVVHDVSELPKMLSLVLRQYFSELASS
jgi:midasin